MTPNPCAEPGCPCEGYDTLQRLYVTRAELAATVRHRDDHPADYASLQALIAAHEQAMGSSVWVHV